MHKHGSNGCEFLVLIFYLSHDGEYFVVDDNTNLQNQVSEAWM